MTSSIPNSDAYNWIIGPASQCVSMVVQETRIASLLQRALVALESQGPLLDLAQQQLARAQLSTRGINELRQQQKGLANEAAHMRKEDFASINRSSLIGLWVSVEVAVEDTIVLILSKDAGGISTATAAGVKATGFTFPPTEADARRLYRRLEGKFRDGASVIEGYSRLLHHFGIGASIPASEETILSEMNYVRNCFMHRNGVVDDRASVEAPRLALGIGDKIAVSRGQYMKYLKSVSTFASALLRGASNSAYVRLKLQNPS